MRNGMRIKIKRTAFKDILDKELYTITAIARDIGTSQSYLSRIQSDNMKYAMSKTMAKKILLTLKHRYTFDDIFIDIS